MEHSETLNELGAALAAAQGEYPTIEKDKEVEVATRTGGKYTYKYADLSTVVETCKGINAGHGLSVVQVPGWDMVNTQHTLVTMLLHSSGQWVSEEMKLTVEDNKQQTHGSALTYARRYAYCAILGIVADVDDDGKGAQSAADDKGTRPMAAPASGTAKKPSGTTKKAAAKEGEETGELFDSRQRNKITSHLSKLDPPVRGDDAVTAHISTVLGLAEQTPLGALTQAEGEKLAGLLGVTL